MINIPWRLRRRRLRSRWAEVAGGDRVTVDREADGATTTPMDMEAMVEAMVIPMGDMVAMVQVGGVLGMEAELAARCVAVPGALQGAEAGVVAAHTNFFLDLPVLYKRCQMSCPSITMACLSAFIVAHIVANMAYNAVDREKSVGNK